MHQIAGTAQAAGQRRHQVVVGALFYGGPGLWMLLQLGSQLTCGKWQQCYGCMRPAEMVCLHDTVNESTKSSLWG